MKKMKRLSVFLSVFAMFALVSLTSCKKVNGEASKYVGSYSFNSVVMEGNTMTATEFKELIKTMPEGSQKKKLTAMADMSFTLTDSYKFNGHNLPDPYGSFGDFSGEWEYSAPTKEIIMINKNEGFQWTFDAFSDGTIGKENGEFKFILAK
ncbi:MAG: hypothetical protein MJ009_06745 [Paludibacteraceae bacterium]|nr:hypothetical protein [Paludibacteraceae bacterium]